MEPNRAWNDPEVDIMSSLIRRGNWYSAEAYDKPNRRWYLVSVEAAVKREYNTGHLAGILEKQLRRYFRAHGVCPPGNTIKIDRRGTSTTFDQPPVAGVDRKLKESLSYGHNPDDTMRTTPIDNLTKLVYFREATDRCEWEGQDCFFTRVELDVDIKVMKSEISKREKLREALVREEVPAAQLDTEMARRYRLLPILAVVIATRPPWELGTVAGFLTPYGDAELERHIAHGRDLRLTRPQLAELVRGVRELRKAGAKHGDIVMANLVVMPGSRELALMGGGSLIKKYVSDAKALGKLLRKCLDNSPSMLRRDPEARSKIRDAAKALENGRFGVALDHLTD